MRRDQQPQTGLHPVTLAVALSASAVVWLALDVVRRVLS